MFPALLGSWRQVLGTNRPPLNGARLIAGFFLWGSINAAQVCIISHMRGHTAAANYYGAIE